MAVKYLMMTLFIGLISYKSAFSNISDLNPFQCVANSKKMNCPVDGKLIILPQATNALAVESGHYLASWNGFRLQVKYKNKAIFETAPSKIF